jgi:acyl carrier protein
LIAYVIVASEVPEDSLIPALRSHVRDRVPAYMVPSAFVLLDRLPLTANGKINRKALPLPRSEHGVQRHEDPPASDVEQKIKKIWSNVLGIPTPHRDDDFFLLGGHSLLVTHVISQLRQSFGIELPIAAIFERPTVAALTETVQAALDGAARQITAPEIEPTGAMLDRNRVNETSDIALARMLGEVEAMTEEEAAAMRDIERSTR